MSREKFGEFAREFCFGFIAMTLIIVGTYAMRKGLNLGMIGSGAFLLYLVYVTRDNSTKIPSKEVDLSGSEIWKGYLKKHPDLCPICPSCNETLDHLEDGRCHDGSYRLCEVYLNREEESEDEL